MAADKARSAGQKEAAIRHRKDSHLVPWRCSCGWLTSRCHMTAQSPSVCGVTRSGATVGITTQLSETWCVNPPSRPTMPKTCAPADVAVSRALTMLTDTFFSTLPPPTENTRTASLELIREPSSQPEKQLSQPSSLARAVSSDTLS